MAPSAINRNVVVGRLMIAGQEAVAMPVIDVPLVSGRGERNGRQQRKRIALDRENVRDTGAIYTI